MSGACSTYGEEKCIQGFGGERGHLEGLGLDGRITLTCIFRKWDVEWINLTQDRDRWRTRVNAVMNLRVP